jgi:hypothetical protein
VAIVNWPHIHLLINHFPVILTVVGSAVLLLALVTNRRGIWLYALATLTLAGLSAYPVFFTGDEAAHALRNTWYVVRDMVHEHDVSAGFALWSLLLTGAASGYTWWRMLRRDLATLPPVWLRTTVTVLAAVTLAIVVRTAYLGGLIVHQSPRLETPPPGFTPPPG